jgi:hypothetical protein
LPPHAAEALLDVLAEVAPELVREVA